MASGNIYLSMYSWKCSYSTPMAMYVLLAMGVCDNTEACRNTLKDSDNIYILISSISGISVVMVEVKVTDKQDVFCK